MNQLISDEELAKALKFKKNKINAIVPALMQLLKLDKLNLLYQKNSNLNTQDFIPTVLNDLNIQYHVSEKDLKNIPQNGSFIIVANHPYGGIDGLILLDILINKRPDIKVLANFLLSKIEPIKDYIINVNPFENIGSKKINISAAKHVLQVIQEHPIAIFPAGEVSALSLNQLKIADKPWQTGVGKLIKNSKVNVIPVYFSGKNSLAFNLLGLLNPSLRTLKLPSELFNKKQPIKVRIGKPIKYKSLEDFSPPALVQYLRAKTYSLSGSLPKEINYFKKLKPLKLPKKIADPTPLDAIIAEIDCLKKNNKLLYSFKEIDIFISSAASIPNILSEIGRLREINFRMVGEGTNRKTDLDEFDKYYKHLFLWDREKNQLAGAYRIGEGDVLFKSFSAKGFYIKQLFKIKKSFYPILSKSIELGRSFIDVNYQKKPYSLMLLWKGVHLYLKQNQDRFKYMIGPVSISGNYNKVSVAFITDYLKKYHFNNSLSLSVKSKNQYKQKLSKDNKIYLKYNNIDNLKKLDDVVEEIEGNGLKVPVLVKKYISLGGQFLSFNVDKNFNNAIDCFLVVEINKIPEDAFNLVSR